MILQTQCFFWQVMVQDLAMSLHCPLHFVKYLKYVQWRLLQSTYFKRLMDTFVRSARLIIFHFNYKNLAWKWFDLLRVAKTCSLFSFKCTDIEFFVDRLLMNAVCALKQNLLKVTKKCLWKLCQVMPLAMPKSCPCENTCGIKTKP